MKGIVFREFLEMVEDKFGEEMADAIIEESNLPSGGAYTSVGTYDHSEMMTLVTKLSERSGLATKDLMKTYGYHIFSVFHEGYPQMFEGINDSFDFLGKIESYIHREVRKLYPDAELPEFQISKPDEKTLIMVYRSKRKMADFAEGLIHRALDHFKDDATVDRETLVEDGSEVKFTITRK